MVQNGFSMFTGEVGWKDMMVSKWRLHNGERVGDETCFGFSSLMEMKNLLGFKMIFLSA